MQRKPLPSVEKPSSLAIIAGRGYLPHLLVKAAQGQERPYCIIAIEGQTEPEWIQCHPHVWVTFAQVGKLITYCKDQNVSDIVMAGGMTRPSFGSLKPDWEGVKWLSKIAAKSFGDDTLLRSVIEMIESYGFRVVGVDDVLSSLLAPSGSLTTLVPDEQAWKDISRGRDVLMAMSAVDVGQAISVRNGVVMAVEAIEGTDAMIKRTGKLCTSMPLDVRPVLVKMAKKGQEKRVDLPTIGLDTLKNIRDAGFGGIAIEAGKTLVLDQERLVAEANAAGLFIVGI